MGVPALRVREREPSDETRQFPVCVRLDDEVPMIRHQAPSQKVSTVTLDCLLENPLERLEIGVGVKNWHAGIAAVEHVIHHASIRCSLWSPHATIRMRPPDPVKKKGS